MTLFGKPLGKPGGAGGPGLVLKFGIGGSLQGYFDEFFRLNAGSGLFGIGGSLVSYFDQLYFGNGGGLFTTSAGDPGTFTWPDGIFGGQSDGANSNDVEGF